MGLDALHLLKGGRGGGTGCVVPALARANDPQRLVSTASSSLSALRVVDDDILASLDGGGESHVHIDHPLAGLCVSTLRPLLYSGFLWNTIGKYRRK